MMSSCNRTHRSTPHGFDSAAPKQNRWQRERNESVCEVYSEKNPERKRMVCPLIPLQEHLSPCHRGCSTEYYITASTQRSIIQQGMVGSTKLGECGVLDQIPTYRDTLWASALQSEALLINFSGELGILNTTTPMSVIPDIGTLPVTCAEVS
ncbi:hypothetical protein U0070_017809 [Myodes glareolus]|uniref:Uncharacterized protein n=1 Tax=Myodes glareolus TaxID=447135 RepID=A0AAW0K8Q0_MYOGA